VTETKCCRCDDDAIRRIGKLRLCAKHARMTQMRYTAKAEGKTVPEMDQLEQLVSALLDFKCCYCDRVMVWFRTRETAGRTVTLQHDRSGAFRLLCLRCNGRHANYPGDSLYCRPDDLHRCCACKEWKSRDQFRHRKSGQDCPYAQCKPCDNKRLRKQKKRRQSKNR